MAPFQCIPTEQHVGCRGTNQHPEADPCLYPSPFSPHVTTRCSYPGNTNKTTCSPTARTDVQGAYETRELLQERPRTSYRPQTPHKCPPSSSRTDPLSSST